MVKKYVKALLILSVSAIALSVIGAEGEGTDANEPLFVKPTPLPAESQIQQALKIVKELCEEDAKVLSSGKASGARFAQQLMAYSSKTDNVAVKFVLFRNAFRQFLAGGDAKAATALFEETFRIFGGRFASEMANYSMSTLRKLDNSSKPSETIHSLKALVDESVASCQELVDAETVLRSHPEDEKAKRKLAFNAVKLMDWGLALKIYAELGGRRGDICRWELAVPESRGDECTFEQCGDYWWSCIDGKDERGLLFRSVSRHAAYWYCKALAGRRMTELKVELVKKRIDRSRVRKGEAADNSVSGKSDNVNVSDMLKAGVNFRAGLVGHWRFDGNANDASGYRNNGIVRGVVPVEDRFGKANKAYRFSGAGYIEVPHSKILNMTHAITITAWIKPHKWWNNSWVIIMQKGDKRNCNYQFSLDINNNINNNRVFLSGFDIVLRCSRHGLELDKWQQVALTYESGKSLCFYCNGVQIGTWKFDKDLQPNNGNILIGYDPFGGAEYFIGDMDDVRLYNRALSEREIQEIFKSEAPVR